MLGDSEDGTFDTVLLQGHAGDIAYVANSPNAIVVTEGMKIRIEGGMDARQAAERNFRNRGFQTFMEQEDLNIDLVIRPEELAAAAKELQAPVDLVRYVAEHGKLPVPNFAAGGVATPADASLLMALGAETVFVGSGIFKSADPASRAKAIVRATTHWQDAKVVAEVSRGIGDAMPGLEMSQVPEEEKLQTRGW